MTGIDQMIADLIRREGGYTNHPADRGGPTRWGVTEAVARQWGYTGPMQELPKTIAGSIYRARYYERPGFALIAEHSEAIAAELFDAGVNMGPSVPSAFLQRWLNALNRNGRDYADLKVDGVVGPNTAAALSAYLKRRDESVLLRALNCSQGHRYLEITEARPENEAFLYGWILNRVIVEAPANA